MTNEVDKTRTSGAPESSRASESPNASAAQPAGGKRASNIARRIRAELLRMANKHIDGDGARIPCITQVAFARYAGCHRATVSRELQALAQDAVVLTRGRRFVVPDIARLQAMQGKARPAPPKR